MKNERIRDIMSLPNQNLTRLTLRLGSNAKRKNEGGIYLC